MLDLDLITDEETLELQKEEVKKDLALPVQVQEKISAGADKNVQTIMNINLDDLMNRREVVSSIENLGNDQIARSNEKNAILEKRLKNIGRQGGESAEVANTLAKLTVQMRELDPSGINFGKKGGLFNPVKKYFAKYEKADNAINDIIKSLDNGKKTLQNDNTTLEIEQVALRDCTKKLQQNVEMAMEMDKGLEMAIEQAKATNDDPEKIKFIEEEVLFPLRQKVMDLQQLQAVNQQGYLAMSIVIRNNKELIRSVDRAKTVTVSALRTAVTVANALYNQQMVLKQVEAVNKTTNDMIMATSRMLKDQGASIQQQAMSTAVSVDTLKEAFRNTFDALEQVDNYKQKALPIMRDTIEQFSELANEGNKRIDRIERRNQMYNAK